MGVGKCICIPWLKAKVTRRATEARFIWRSDGHQVMASAFMVCTSRAIVAPALGLDLPVGPGGRINPPNDFICWAFVWPFLMEGDATALKGRNRKRFSPTVRRRSQS